MSSSYLNLKIYIIETIKLKSNIKYKYKKIKTKELSITKY